jgi:hypothetical protein
MQVVSPSYTSTRRTMLGRAAGGRAPFVQPVWPAGASWCWRQSGAGTLMDGDYTRRDIPGGPGQPDARASALADYLRERAAAFSLSADVRQSQSTASAGMALLDAAHIADAMTTNDPRLTLLSEAGLFESMPGGRARFLETLQIRAAIQRPLIRDPQDGEQIIAYLVATVLETPQP